MVQSENTEKHKEAVDQLKAYFKNLSNKDQAWQDLHRLMRMMTVMCDGVQLMQLCLLIVQSEKRETHRRSVR